MYAVGWIKRGPTGILGTNKRDAEETVDVPRRGPAGGRSAAAAEPRPRADRRAACERKPDLVTAEGWRAIDAAERERGRGAERPRVKLASRDELLAAARP